MLVFTYQLPLASWYMKYCAQCEIFFTLSDACRHLIKSHIYDCLPPYHKMNSLAPRQVCTLLQSIWRKRVQGTFRANHIDAYCSIFCQGHAIWKGLFSKFWVISIACLAIIGQVDYFMEQDISLPYHDLGTLSPVHGLCNAFSMLSIMNSILEFGLLPSLGISWQGKCLL